MMDFKGMMLIIADHSAMAETKIKAAKTRRNMYHDLK